MADSRSTAAARPATGSRRFVGRVRLLLRRSWRYIIALHGSPEEIALGAGIGVFVAFSPTIGLQIIIAAFLATVLGASRPAAIIMVWITNPLTIPPIYAFTYSVGARFWPGPDAPVSQVFNLLTRFVRQLTRHEAWDLFDQFRELLRLGVGMLVPMAIGGVIVGLFSGTITYVIVRWTLHRYRNLRERLKRRSAERSGAI